MKPKEYLKYYPILVIRSFLFYSGHLPVTVIYGFTSLFLGLFPKAFAQAFIISWNGFILWWLRITCGIEVKISGNLNKSTQPAVIVSNHQSAWETLFLQLYFKPVATILKKELLRIPFFGWGLKLLEPIAIDRSNPLMAFKQIKQQGVASLQQGKNLIIFPEGTRQPAGQIGTYKRGAVDIAQRAGAPILPVAHNAGEHWCNKKFIKTPGTIHVVLGELIDTQNVDSKALIQQLQAWTKSQLDSIKLSENSDGAKSIT